MQTISRFVALSWTEKRLHLGVALALVTTKAALLILPGGWLQRWIFVPEAPESRAGDDTRLYEIIRAIERVSRALQFLHINCLPQALVARALLHREGYSVELKIGVLKEDCGTLTAHAWIERGGEILLGGRESFKRFEGLSPLTGTGR